MIPMRPFRHRRGLRQDCVRLLLIIWLALLSGVGMAATVDPFIARVDVPDRSEAARRNGVRAALDQVLVKLTGRPEAASRITADAIDPLVQQYRYLETAATPDQPARIELEVRFTPGQVRTLAEQAGLPLWPLERGETAVWIAIEEAGQRSLLGTEEHHDPLRQAIMQSAMNHAVPVVLPLMDLVDQGAVSTAEIWGGFSDRVRSANERYGVPYMLIGRVEPGAGGWRARWVLDVGRDVDRWESSGATPEAAITAAVSGVAERLARRFAVGSQPQQTTGEGVHIRVVGVGTPRSYGRLISYLESLSVVRQVAVERVRGNAIELKLQVDGDEQSLVRLLEIDRVLAAEPVGHPRPPMPVFRLDELSMR